MIKWDWSKFTPPLPKIFFIYHSSHGSVVFYKLLTDQSLVLIMVCTLAMFMAQQTCCFLDALESSYLQNRHLSGDPQTGRFAQPLRLHRQREKNIFETWHCSIFFLTEIHVDSPIVKQGFAKLWHVRMKSINLTWFGLRPSIILLICDNFSLERCGEICLVWSMCRDWIRFLKHWCCLLEMFTIFRIALEWVRNFFHVAPPPHCSIGFDVLLLLLCSRSLHVDN